MCARTGRAAQNSSESVRPVGGGLPANPARAPLGIGAKGSSGPPAKLVVLVGPAAVVEPPGPARKSRMSTSPLGGHGLSSGASACLPATCRRADRHTASNSEGGTSIPSGCAWPASRQRSYSSSPSSSAHGALHSSMTLQAAAHALLLREECVSRKLPSSPSTAARAYDAHLPPGSARRRN